jgi:hypothetical protein
LRIPFSTARAVATAVTAACAGAGFGGLLLLLTLTATPRWLAVVTVLLAVVAASGAAWLARLQALARHPFRILAARHSISVRHRDPDTSGVPLASVTVASETEFEPLQEGAAVLRLQKFVTEPSSLDPARLLADWRYASRIGADAAEPRPYLSESRSLQLDLPLAGVSEPFTLAEELSFDTLLDAPARFVFQPSYPAGREEIEVVFLGPRPLRPRYRIDRGLGAVESGTLSLSDPARLAFVWKNAVPGQQLALEWDWDAASLPAPMSETERLIAFARERQAELEKRLAVQFRDVEPDESDTAPAEEHWVIKAARLRETLYAGGTPETPTLAGDSGFVSDADDTPAEDHPIIKAAREREKLYKDEG